MSPVENATQYKRRTFAITIGIIFAGIWVFLILSLISGERLQNSPSNSVIIHSASPTGGGSPSATYTAPRPASSSLLRHFNTPSPIRWSYTENMPQASMSSTSIRIHQTSSASIHSVGGGSATNVIATTSSSNNGGRGIRYTASSYSGSIYRPTAHNSISAVGASSANEVTTSSSETAPMTRPGNIRTARKDGLPGYNEDPDPNEVETPIGDTPWFLMVLLTIGWCVRRRLKKQ